VATLSKEQTPNKPPWLKIKLPTHENYFYVAGLLKRKNLHTICQSAKCPNITECWTRRTATFMILGDICTRNCGFCAVSHGIPGPISEDEASCIAESVSAMGLEYVVITSVTRDDLPDGGASQFHAVIGEIRRVRPAVCIEVLVPDFNGSESSLDTILDADPEVLNHNLEVPEKLYPVINRPARNYQRSLRLLQRAKNVGSFTKSGIMVGLGEGWDDLIQTFRDIRETGCDLLTVGQYLQATKKNPAVVKYYSPGEFLELKQAAIEIGFADVESGPLVRSSYRAHRLFENLKKRFEMTN
jgi:lipoic acid synthetase